MKNSFKCPYCGQFTPYTSETHIAHTLTTGSDSEILGTKEQIFDSRLALYYDICAACGKYTVSVEGFGKEVDFTKKQIFPVSDVMHYPEYIPEQIRKDYEEACAIKNLSPKASATLSRRCLQGMIRDFWQIEENTLYKEIESLENKVDPSQKQILHALRKLGNIGAHHDNDVSKIIDIEPDEADKMIKIIELLINEWYISRFEKEQLYNDVLAISDSKKSH